MLDIETINPKHLEKLEDILVKMNKKGCGAFSVFETYNTRDNYGRANTPTEQDYNECAQDFLSNFQKMYNIEVFKVSDDGIDFFFSDGNGNHYFLSNVKESDGSTSKVIFEYLRYEYITLDTIQAHKNPRRRKLKTTRQDTTDNKVIAFKEVTEPEGVTEDI